MRDAYNVNLTGSVKLTAMYVEVLQDDTLYTGVLFVRKGTLRED